MKTYDDQQLSAMRTSFLTAFPKIFSDIEYSLEFFSEMKNLATEKGFTFLPEHFSNEMSVEIEARHKSLNHAIKSNLVENTLIIEIASGLSPRHLQFSSNEYVECDFKPIMDIKREIYKSMGHENLVETLCDADISNVKKFKNFITKSINKKNYQKIIIVNEGLFWYLSKPIIQKMTQQIISVLKGKNWIWITTDCPVVDKNNFEHRKIISKSANVKRGGIFKDYNDFSSFFNDIGLTNISYSLSNFIKYQDLSSAKFFSIEKQDAINRIDSYTKIAILQPKWIVDLARESLRASAFRLPKKQKNSKRKFDISQNYLRKRRKFWFIYAHFGVT